MINEIIVQNKNDRF